jgi:hypothetical protein
MSTAEINKTKLYLIALINRLSNENFIEFLDGLKKSKSRCFPEQYQVEQHALTTLPLIKVLSTKRNKKLGLACLLSKIISYVMQQCANIWLTFILPHSSGVFVLSLFILLIISSQTGVLKILGNAMNFFMLMMKPWLLYEFY